MRLAITGCQRGVVLLGVAMALAGCGGHQKPAAGAADAIAQFDATKLNASFRAIDDAALGSAAQTRQAALARIGDHDPGIHYAALYALALTVAPGQVTSALESALRSPNQSERLLAARGLLAHGDKRAIPTMIAALKERFVPAFGNPPEPAWQVARFDLVQYVPVDLGLIGRHVSAARASAAAARWRSWWSRHGASLRWDGTARVYRIR